MTQTQLTNFALTHLEEITLSSFDEDTDTARLVRENWPLFIDRFYEYPWRFATTTATVAQIITDQDDLRGYRYKFQLPSDLVNIRKIADSRNSRVTDFTISGDGVFADSDKIIITYTRQVEIENLPSFVSHYAAMLLADVLCMGITTDLDKKIQIAGTDGNGGELKTAERKAKLIDSQQAPADHYDSDHLIDARFGRSRGEGY